MKFSERKANNANVPKRWATSQRSGGREREGEGWLGGGGSEPVAEYLAARGRWSNICNKLFGLLQSH